MGCSSMISLPYRYREFIYFPQAYLGMGFLSEKSFFLLLSPTFNTFTILALDTYSTGFDDD